MKVYIAGPIRGIPEFNAPAFDAAEKRWREAGHTPFSPISVDRALAVLAGSETPEHLKLVMQLDTALIFNADAIALLPGWEKSSGATVELALAQFLKLPVYEATTGNPMYPRITPWSGLTTSTYPFKETANAFNL